MTEARDSPDAEPVFALMAMNDGTVLIQGDPIRSTPDSVAGTLREIAEKLEKGQGTVITPPVPHTPN